jgi:transposase, IS5 family
LKYSFLPVCPVEWAQSCKLSWGWRCDSLPSERRWERFAMRPDEPRRSGQSDLFRARPDQIIDLCHPLAKLAATIDWRFLEERFGAVYSDKPGQPPLPTRLMAGLSILKRTHDLSDEDLCTRWIENPYFQLFCGEEFFRHRLPFDRSSLTRWRQRTGEEKLVALIQGA